MGVKSMQSFHMLSQYLQQGQTFLYPTDTIYGLGCDALNADAVARVQKAKGRDSNKPFLILTSSLEVVQEYFELPRPVERGLKILWPGPYTVLLTPNTSFKQKIPSALIGPTGKVGVRVPALEEGSFLNHLFQDDDQKWSGLLVSTSANRAGESYSREWEILESLFLEKVDHLVKEAHFRKETCSSALLDWDKEWKVLRTGREKEEELLKRLYSF